MRPTKDLTVSFPTVGLPIDRELLGAELRKPKKEEYFFCSGAWHQTKNDFDIYEPFVAILSPEGDVETLVPGGSK